MNILRCNSRILCRIRFKIETYNCKRKEEEKKERNKKEGRKTGEKEERRKESKRKKEKRKKGRNKGKNDEREKEEKKEDTRERSKKKDGTKKKNLEIFFCFMKSTFIEEKREHYLRERYNENQEYV